MDLQGIIFDFNGTLFRDSEKHEIAWQEFAAKHRDEPLTRAEFDRHVHGKSNQQIIEYIFQATFSLEEAAELAEGKEAIYRELCLADQVGLHLLEGAPELLDYLTAQGYLITIATASGKKNVDFFFDVFNLGKWFDYDKVIYDDGIIKSKPAPDFYLNASQAIGKLPEECLVFEDSLSGIKAAQAAQVQGVIAIATNGNQEQLARLEPLMIIDDFRDERLKDVLAKF